MMVFFKLFSVAVICLFQLWRCNGSSSVKEFENLNSFTSELSAKEWKIVDFYASWCPHCVSLAPNFDKAAELLEAGSLKNKVELDKIRCDVKKDAICKKFDITGYPTLKVFHKGKFFEGYIGGRSPADIVKYVQTIVKTSKRQFPENGVKPHQKICLAKSYRKYVHKS